MSLIHSKFDVLILNICYIPHLHVYVDTKLIGFVFVLIS